MTTSNHPGPGGAKRVFALAFAGALVFYVIAYATLEHWKSRNGPWHVTFRTTGTEASLAIHQHRLGITNVQILFRAETQMASSAPASRPTGNAVDQEADSPASNRTNIEQTLTFQTPRPVPFDLPFGRCIFLDLTTLPGTVTMQFRGHEIELLPRTLIVDHREHPWRATARLELD